MIELAYVGEARSEPRCGSPPAPDALATPIFELLNGAVALVIALFLLPLLVVIAVAISSQDGGPVLFRHRRIGRGGRSFDCFKFRTMNVDAEHQLGDLLVKNDDARREWEQAHKLRNDPRVTPLGAFLRRTSLDELPQIINLLRGDMSLVGPRPIVEAEVPRYGWRIRQYYAVKPGVTGLWQVNGRSNVTYRSRVAMDCLYVRRKSVLLDLRILFCTIPAVIGKRGSC